MHGNNCECRETFWTMMLQWLIRLLCRPVIRNGLAMTARMNTEYELDQLLMRNMDSPRLAVTLGEWYDSDTLTPLSRDLRQMYGIPEVMGAMHDRRTAWDFHQFDCSAFELDDMTFRRPVFPPEKVHAGGNTCGVVMLDDLIFRHTSFPPDELSAGRDGIDTTDCNTVWGFPHMNSAVADCGAVDLIFRRTNFPPNDLFAGRDGDYIWRDMWTGLSVCNRSVTGSLPFGSSQRLGRCCLWLAALPSRWIGSAEVPLRHHLLLAVSSSELHEVTLSSQLTGMHQAGDAELDTDPSEHSAPMTNAGHVEDLPSSGPLEHSVLGAKWRNDNLDSSNEPQFGSDLGHSSLELEDAIRREVLRSRSMGRVSARDVNGLLFFSGIRKCLWMRSARRAYGSGIWIWMWNINMRHLTVCRCITVEMYMMQRTRRSMILSKWRARRMWRTIILMFWNGIDDLHSTPSR